MPGVAGCKLPQLRILKGRDMAALRIGVIGVGGRGGLAGHAHDPKHGVVLAGGADVNETALEKFKEKYPFITEEDLTFNEGKEQEMIEMLGYKLGKTKEELVNIIVQLD